VKQYPGKPMDLTEMLWCFYFGDRKAIWAKQSTGTTILKSLYFPEPAKPAATLEKWAD